MKKTLISLLFLIGILLSACGAQTDSELPVNTGDEPEVGEPIQEPEEEVISEIDSDVENTEEDVDIGELI